MQLIPQDSHKVKREDKREVTTRQSQKGRSKGNVSAFSTIDINLKPAFP